MRVDGSDNYVVVTVHGLYREGWLSRKALAKPVRTGGTKKRFGPRSNPPSKIL